MFCASIIIAYNWSKFTMALDVCTLINEPIVEYLLSLLTNGLVISFLQFRRQKSI